MAEEAKNKVNDLSKELKDMKGTYESRKLPGEMTTKMKEAMEKTKTELDKLKGELIKKFNYIRAIGIIPPQTTKFFSEEEFEKQEEVDANSKLIHLVVIIPEEKYKKIKEIKAGMLKVVEDLKQTNVWLHIFSHVDVFNYGLDGKYENMSAISMAFPLHDKDGFLANMRVAEIHKSLVLRKFERYVQSYIMAGSFVRGDTVKSSDVDTYVVIDDTDVKKMPRLELKEKLRGIIYSYIAEASELAGVKGILNVQVSLLTEFWESVKDAQPVVFTFIRDGIPLYDRGTFMPWKLLLKMGKLKPSPEAIDMFMSMGDKLKEIVNRRLLDIAIGDIYWSVITPSQALVMLYGRAPPTTKETPHVIREIFCEKENMLEKKYADIVEKVIKLYKDYEHQKISEVSGKEVDELLKDAMDYIARLKELRKQIEKRGQSKTLEQIHEDVFKILNGMFHKNSESALIKSFEEELVKTGRVNPRHLHVLKEIAKIKDKKEVKGRDKKKAELTKHEVEEIRKDAAGLINELIEYNQRCEMVNLQKGRMRIKTKDNKIYELVLTNMGAFLIDQGEIKKVTSTMIVSSNEKELAEAITKQAALKNLETRSRVFSVIEKELGDFEILM